MIETILRVSLIELCQTEGITQQIILEVVEHGIAQPLAGEQIDDWVFDTTTAHWLKKAVRLNRDLELDWIAVAMVIDLLQQKELLELENQRFQRQIAHLLE